VEQVSERLAEFGLRISAIMDLIRETCAYAASGIGDIAPARAAKSLQCPGRGPVHDWNDYRPEL